VGQFEFGCEILEKLTPLLEQEGWLRIKKTSRSSFDTADGVVILD
jgi:hypothetical protein